MVMGNPSVAQPGVLLLGTRTPVSGGQKGILMEKAGEKEGGFASHLGPVMPWGFASGVEEDFQVWETTESQNGLIWKGS